MESPYRNERIELDENSLEASPDSEVIMNVVRHGETEYKELRDPKFVFDPDQPDFELSPKFLDLTWKGIDDVRASALQLIERIDPDNEVILILTSPNFRAQSTALIIQDELTGRHIELLTKSPRLATGLEQLKFKNKSDTKTWIETAEVYMAQFDKDNKPTPDVAHPAIAQEMGTTLGELAEDYTQVALRFNHFIRHYGNIKSHLEPETQRTIGKKKIRIISITHEDAASVFLQDVLGKGTNIQKSQIMELTPHSDHQELGSSIDLTVELLPMKNYPEADSGSALIERTFE